MWIYERSKSELWVLVGLRLQEFEGSILISTPTVAQIIVNLCRTSFRSPKRSRIELTPKLLDRSTPNGVPRLCHTLEIMAKIQFTHLNLTILVKSIKKDFGWCFWHPRPALRMPDGPYASGCIAWSQDLINGSIMGWTRHAPDLVSLRPWPQNSN